MKATTMWSASVALLACACAGSDQNADSAARPDAASGTDTGADKAERRDLVLSVDSEVDAGIADRPMVTVIDMAGPVDQSVLDGAGGVDTFSAMDAGGAIDLAGAVDVATAVDAVSVLDAGAASPPTCHTFKSEGGSQLYLDNLQMISPSLGYGIEAQNGGLVDLHRTSDGGRTWTKLTTVDTGNRGSDASLAIGFYADELWLSTSFSGFGTDGTLLRSTDAANWTRMESGIRALWNNLAEPIGTIARVLADGELFVVVGEDGNSLAVTANQGTTWRRVDLSVQSAILAATQSHLFVRANTSSSSNDWGLYRFASDNLQALKANLPSDFRLTRWVVAPNDDVITLVDDESSITPGRTLLASSDGGATFDTLLQHGASGDADGYLLRRGIAVGTAAFASLGRSGVKVRITRSRDHGTTWTTLLEESTSTDHYYWFQTDYQGNAYAIRHSYYSIAICLLQR